MSDPGECSGRLCYCLVLGRVLRVASGGGCLGRRGGIRDWNMFWRVEDL